MLGPLAKELHKRNVTSDHNRMMVETVNDIITDDNDEDVDLNDLDRLLDDDVESVPDDHINKLDKLIGSVVEKQEKDVVNMTEEEIENSIKDVDINSLEELDDEEEDGDDDEEDDDLDDDDFDDDDDY